MDYLVVELDFTALNVLGTGGFDLGSVRHREEVDTVDGEHEGVSLHVVVQ